MTRELVERLRRYQVGPHDGPPLHPAICDEAASEIEFLFDQLDKQHAVGFREGYELCKSRKSA